ncbi:MAG: TnpV protein [Ruminococcus sp.]
MELTYHRKGDYLFPNLIIKEETVAIGKYGMLRKTFLKEHRKNWYQSMMLTGKLENHLAQTEKAAQERMEVLMKGVRWNVIRLRRRRAIRWHGQPI